MEKNWEISCLAKVPAEHEPPLLLSPIHALVPLQGSSMPLDLDLPFGLDALGDAGVCPREHPETGTRH